MSALAPNLRQKAEGLFHVALEPGAPAAAEHSISKAEQGVRPPRVFDQGADSHVVVGDLRTPAFNYVELSQRPQTNCGGVPTAIDVRNDVPIGGSWTDSPNLTMTTTSSTGGLGFFAWFEDPAPFTICFDDGYIGIGLVPVELQYLAVE